MSLSLNDLAIHKLDGSELFSSLSLHLESGEVLALMGPSGCGKSTLLDVIAGHLSNEFEYTGQVHVNDMRIDQKIGRAHV